MRPSASESVRHRFRQHRRAAFACPAAGCDRQRAGFAHGPEIGGEVEESVVARCRLGSDRQRAPAGCSSAPASRSVVKGMPRAGTAVCARSPGGGSRLREFGKRAGAGKAPRKSRRAAEHGGSAPACRNVVHRLQRQQRTARSGFPAGMARSPACVPALASRQERRARPPRRESPSPCRFRQRRPLRPASGKTARQPALLRSTAPTGRQRIFACPLASENRRRPRMQRMPGACAPARALYR